MMNSTGDSELGPSDIKEELGPSGIKGEAIAVAEEEIVRHQEESDELYRSELDPKR